MRKFAMCAFPATWDFVKSDFSEIVDKLSDFPWHFYRFNIERKLFDAERRASAAAESRSEGRVDRERGHYCLFSRSPPEPDIQLSKYPALQFLY